MSVREMSIVDEDDFSLLVQPPWWDSAVNDWHRPFGVDEALRQFKALEVPMGCTCRFAAAGTGGIRVFPNPTCPERRNPTHDYTRTGS